MKSPTRPSGRTIGMLLTFFGVVGASAVLLQWIPGVRQNVALLALSLMSLFVGRRISIQAGGSAELVARGATATMLTLLIVAAIMVAVAVAIVFAFFALLAER
ncbi:MAG: hypothetical protein R3C20_20840 [Planctomycetaceae bacterium]